MKHQKKTSTCISTFLQSLISLFLRPPKSTTNLPAATSFHGGTWGLVAAPSHVLSFPSWAKGQVHAHKRMLIPSRLSSHSARHSSSVRNHPLTKRATIHKTISLARGT